MSRQDTDRSGVELACLQPEDKPDGLLSDDDADQELSFEVEIASTTPSSVVVLADQIKSLDWRVRNATRKGAASQTSWLCSPQLYQDR